MIAADLYWILVRKIDVDLSIQPLQKGKAYIRNVRPRNVTLSLELNPVALAVNDQFNSFNTTTELYFTEGASRSVTALSHSTTGDFLERPESPSQLVTFLDTICPNSPPNASPCKGKRKGEIHQANATPALPTGLGLSLRLFGSTNNSPIAE
ncbi:hypothetical protein AX16_003233 [Volvariella volvacea WC 439]|nr:hypothetical protein AX16_003233 [Volvariella volvacea WC 439]